MKVAKNRCILLSLDATIALLSKPSAKRSKQTVWSLLIAIITHAKNFIRDLCHGKWNDKFDTSTLYGSSTLVVFAIRNRCGSLFLIYNAIKVLFIV